MGKSAMAMPYLVHQLLFIRALSSGTTISRSLRDSYRLLQLPEEEKSSPSQVKEAYLHMAKLYHPDSGTATADASMFARVEEAYRAVLAHKSHFKGRKSEEEEEEDKLKSLVPQHRHYLSYEGVGTGTPSQRERQYQQFRVDRAAGQVLNYRQKEHEKAAAEEGEIVVRDVRNRSRQIKITQAVERLVEDMILESMARGDFRNLRGSGKPVSKFDHNPYADPMTHNLNRILIDNGYQPPWIVTQRDIRETTAQLRDKLLQGRTRLGESMTQREKALWQQLCGSVGEELVNLNKMVDNFNLIVPVLTQQMVHFSLDREIARAEKAACQLRQKREREREEKNRSKTNTPVQTRRGLLSWIQSLLK